MTSLDFEENIYNENTFERLVALAEKDYFNIVYYQNEKVYTKIISIITINI